MDKILFLTPKVIVPPINGGDKCMYFRINGISKYIDTSLAMGNGDNIEKNLSLAKKYMPCLRYQYIFKGNDREIKKVVFWIKLIEGIKWFFSGRTRLVQRNTKKAYRKFLMKYILSNNISHVCLEQPYMWDFLDKKLLKKYNIRVVYIAHNIEYLYWKDLNYSAGIKLLTKIELNRLKAFEKEVVNQSNLVIGISPDDVKYINNNMKPVKAIYLPTILKNVEKTWYETNSNYICFCGSLKFFPNYHGIKWFLDNVFIKYIKIYPNIKLKITGNITDEIKKDLCQYNNIEFTGFVSEEELQNIMTQSLFAIVSILKGSGVKIKLLELLSYGVPVVATQHAANGVPYGNNMPYLTGFDSNNFLANMIKLTKDDILRKSLSSTAKTFIKKEYSSEYNIKRWIKYILSK